ncbi:6-pyruvoyl-tetrahydropterin synthase [Bradyrhizobium yuanmingense]
MPERGRRARDPTAENIAVWIWYRLKPSLPQLWAVRVNETADCWAEYQGRWRSMVL